MNIFQLDKCCKSQILYQNISQLDNQYMTLHSHSNILLPHTEDKQKLLSLNKTLLNRLNKMKLHHLNTFLLDKLSKKPFPQASTGLPHTYYTMRPQQLSISLDRKSSKMLNLHLNIGHQDS